LKRVKELLGWNWYFQGKGQLLREEVDTIKRKLNIDGQYEEWKLKVTYQITNAHDTV